MPRLQRASAYLFVVLLIVFSFAALDEVTAPVTVATLPSARVDAVDAEHLQAGWGVSPENAREPRLFALLIDSLRYETAVGGDFMPNTARLRHDGAFAKVEPTRDAVTAPSIRAAFTGEDRTRILGFATNFLRHQVGSPTLFTALVAEGRKAAVFTDSAFDQFGREGLDWFTNGDDGPTEVRDQSAAALRAAATFATGHYALVVIHVTFTDHIAHEQGIAGPGYRERFAVADRLVATLEQIIPKTDTFVVLGDHGHDREGRHAFGLDVPTFTFYRGPRYRPDTDLGTISIRDHRYLMSYGLGLRLPSDYAAGRYPRALVLDARAPAEFRIASGDDPSRDGVPRARRGDHALLALYVAGLFTLWFLTLVDDGPRARVARGVTWLCLGLFAVAPYSALGLGLGLSLAVVGMVDSVRRRLGMPWRVRTALYAGLGLAFVGFFYGVGRAFPLVRPLIHEPRYGSLAALWSATLVVALGLAWKHRSERLAWLWSCLPLFLFLPTVYRYGAPACMSPAWVTWAIVTALFFCSPSVAPSTPTTAMDRPVPRWLLVLGLMCFLVPFIADEASDYRFDEWILLPGNTSLLAWRILGFLGKGVVFLRPRGSRPDRLLGFVAVATLGAAEAGLLPRSGESLLAVGACVAAIALPARRSALLLPGVLYVYHALTRSPEQTYYWQDCLLAALVLSAHLAARYVVPRARALSYAILSFFSLFAGGWIALSFTVHRLEWHFLYDVFHAPFVERHVGVFIPLIVARYALPVVAARLVLAETLGTLEAYPRRLVSLLVGTKIASVVLVAFGLAFANAASDIYLESAQEAVIATVVAAGLLT
jgi:hypothetical protein